MKSILTIKIYKIFLVRIPIYFFFIVLFFVTGCAFHTNTASFDPETCFEKIPRHVDGLKIISGIRKRENIIREMLPAICQGHALFNNIQSKDPDLKPGTVIFKIVIEYTGEVNSVVIEKTTIKSQAFLRKISGFIMDTDFAYWERDDMDSVFLYPVIFGE